MNNKGLIITLIIVLSVLGIVLTVLMINLLGGNITFNFGGISDELAIDTIYDYQKLEKVNISTDMSETYIKPSNDDKVHVIIHGKKDKNTSSLDGNTLNIESKEEKCFGFCLNHKSSKVEVYLPRDYQGDMHISNNYGDIEVGDFINATMSVIAKAGDINIENTYKVDVRNDYGDITMGSVKVAKIKDSCGDIKVRDAESLDVSNDYGNIEIDRVTNEINIDESCGDVLINSLDLKNNSNIKNSLGNIEIGSTNEIYIEADVDLGKTKINNNYRESSIVLKLKNNCGDIKVNN